MPRMYNSIYIYESLTHVCFCKSCVCNVGGPVSGGASKHACLACVEMCIACKSISSIGVLLMYSGSRLIALGRRGAH